MSDYKKHLESTLYNVRVKNAFYGSILQSMNIYQSSQLPTAGVCFNRTNKLFEMFINKEFFDALTLEEQCAIFHHEIKHITHGHLVKLKAEVIEKSKRELMNIAGDMVINQELEHIPNNKLLFTTKKDTEHLDKVAIVFEADKKHVIPFDFTGMTNLEMANKTKKEIEEKKIQNLEVIQTKNSIKIKYNGEKVKIQCNHPEIYFMMPVMLENFEGLEPKQTIDYYYNKLKERKDNNQCLQCGAPLDEHDCDGQNDPSQGSGGQGEQGQGEGQESSENGNGGQSGGSEECNHKKGCKKCGGGFQVTDHKWLDGEDQEKLASLRKMIKRSLNKTQFGYSSELDGIKELLQYIEGKEAQLDYENLLLHHMKASLPSNKRVGTWTRRNRRFGYKAPGRKMGDYPKLSVFIDTSGSISIEEANEFLKIVDKFLEVGASKCTLNLFHTSVYESFEYKRKKPLDAEIFQSGSTCLEGVMEKIAKTVPDLTIVLTDGYYCNVDTSKYIQGDKMPKTLFIISKQGDVNHPFSDRMWGKTVKIPE